MSNQAESKFAEFGFAAFGASGQDVTLDSTAELLDRILGPDSIH